MSSKAEPQEAPGDEGEGSCSSDEFESWLRRAARASEEPRRVPLPHEGQVISGKYRIEAQLGRGGMGAVYRARHIVSDKPVGLKWMLRPASEDRAKRRVAREARAAGRIDHPNVVDVYDIGEEGEAVYLVMELLHGESLSTRLTRGALDAREAVDLLLPALHGVAAAHREGVVHRDLKPDNIFLCVGPDGSRREAKVLDFGVSTIASPDYDSQTTLTKEGTVIGTPAYMAPEQLENPSEADARADVYAFGVILYECLTGRLPFEGETYSALVLAIALGAPPPLRALRPELPVELERVVMRAIDRDRERRFASADKFAEALAPFSSASMSAPWPSGSSISPTASRGLSRARAVLLVTGAVVLALTAIWLLSRDGERQLAEPHPASPPSAPRAAPAASASEPTAPPTEEPARMARPKPAQPDALPAARAPEPTEATLEAQVDAPTPPHRAQPQKASARPAPPAPEPAARRNPPVEAAPPRRPARSGSISMDDL